MNLFILIFLLVISLLCGGAIVVRAASYSEIKYPTIHPDPLDLERLVWAIKQVENWDGHTRGAMGEWGAMQMRPAIYKRYANDELGYVQKLVDEARSLNRLPTPWLIGLLHNAGYPAVAKHRAHAAKLDFAQRVENCYEDRSLTP